MPDLTTVTCVTVVAESLIQQELARAIEKCGARGWTVTMAQGTGPGAHGVSGIEGGNIRFEALVSADTAARIWAVLESDFFPYYAVTAWSYDVQVSRAARFAD